MYPPGNPDNVNAPECAPRPLCPLWPSRSDPLPRPQETPRMPRGVPMSPPFALRIPRTAGPSFSRALVGLRAASFSSRRTSFTFHQLGVAFLLAEDDREPMQSRRLFRLVCSCRRPPAWKVLLRRSAESLRRSATSDWAHGGSAHSPRRSPGRWFTGRVWSPSLAVVRARSPRMLQPGLTTWYPRR